MLDPRALDALKNNQRQLDADGCEVGVSRQALNELIAAYESLSTVTPAEVGGLVERLRNPADRYCTQSVRDEAASLIQSQAARIAELESAIRENWHGRYWRMMTDDDADRVNSLLNKERRV